MQINLASSTSVLTNTDLINTIQKGGSMLNYGDYTCTYDVVGGNCDVAVFRTVGYGLFKGVLPKDIPDSITASINAHLEPVNGSNAVSNTNAKIKSTLFDCAALISALSDDLETAQVKCYPLTHFTNNSSYRAAKARYQLIEKGYIRNVGKGFMLTELGLELRLGTHTRSPETKVQTIRYSDEVLKHIDFTLKKGSPVKRIKGVKFKDKSGKVHTAESIPSFSKEHNLVRGKMYMMIKGVVMSHRGWTLA